MTLKINEITNLRTSPAEGGGHQRAGAGVGGEEARGWPRNEWPYRRPTQPRRGQGSGGRAAVLQPRACLRKEGEPPAPPRPPGRESHIRREADAPRLSGSFVRGAAGPCPAVALNQGSPHPGLEGQLPPQFPHPLGGALLPSPCEPRLPRGRRLPSPSGTLTSAQSSAPKPGGRPGGVQPSPGVFPAPNARHRRTASVPARAGRPRPGDPRPFPPTAHRAVR